MAPKVSVCIPAYNNGKYLSNTILSVLSQTFYDYEVVIIDDCSRDNTVDIAKQYARQDSRIVIHCNESNIGMVQNWNRCLETATGEYIKYVFGDDLLNDSTSLQRMVDILDTKPEVSLVSSARFLIDEDSSVIDQLTHFPDGLLESGGAVIARCLAEYKNYIGEPSVVMFRKRQALRNFDPRYRQLVDLEMWFHLLEQGSFYYIDVPLSSFRVHPAQQSNVNRKNLSHIDDIAYMNSEYLDKGYLKPGCVAKWFIIYNQFYRCWKLTRTEGENHDKALEKIERHYGYSRFRLGMPLYKVLSPYYKLKRLLLDRQNEPYA